MTNYLHERKDFQALLETVAQNEKINDPALVEKDYWIMHSLFGLKTLGLSFELKGGEEHFKKALYVVANAPEETNITGWKAFDGNRNRYFLANNVTNNKLNEIHDIFYAYFRTGLDYLYEDEITARTNILSALELLQDFNQQNPNSMILQFFMQGRSDEIIGVFKKADPLTKSKAIEILTKIDVSNTTKYRAELK